MRTRYVAGSIFHMSKAESSLTITRLRLAILILLFFAVEAPQIRSQDKSKTVPPQATQTYTREGVSVEFSIEPVASGKISKSHLLADSDATVRFKIVEANGGKA